VEESLGLADKIPFLCTVVVASPFDAALHDGFGKAHGLNCYRTYGPEFMSHDIVHYLGHEFHGETLERYVRQEPQSRMPLYHLIGALDPLEDKDVAQRIGDGLPETLPEWIRHDGLTHLKIKLNGDNLAWDVERVANVDRVAETTQRERGVTRWHYSLDFNEKCPNVAYLLDFLKQVRERRPDGFARIQYIEQPTARDLAGNRGRDSVAVTVNNPIAPPLPMGTTGETISKTETNPAAGSPKNGSKTPDEARLSGSASCADAGRAAAISRHSTSAPTFHPVAFVIVPPSRESRVSLTTWQ